MNKDQQIAELKALLDQERAYAYKLKEEAIDLRQLQHHLVSGMQVWKDGFEKLFHEHHRLAGRERASECCVCLREHEFPLSELVPGL